MKRILIAMLVFSIVIIISFYGWIKIKNRSRECSAFGTISATTAALYDEVNRRNTNVIVLLQSAAKQERDTLSESDFDSLFAELSRKHQLDPPKNWKPGLPMTDPWESRFQVSIKSLGEGRFNYIVRSCGPDRISGSDDDIQGIMLEYSKTNGSVSRHSPNE